MANQKTEGMDTAVRAEMMRLLRERVRNPTLMWTAPHGRRPTAELRAALILKEAGFLNSQSGAITLAGMDYYRKETTNPVLTWLRSNWFAVIVAGCTIGVSIFGIVSG